MYRDNRPSNPQWGGWACASTNPGDLAPAQPYIKSIQILQCPSQASATNSAGPGSPNSCQDGGYTDYFYNSHVGSTPTTANTSIAGTPGRNLSEFEAVSLTILLGDGQNTNATSFSHGGIDAAASVSGPAKPAYDNWKPTTVDATRTEAVRHLEGANYAFVDGHVKWLKQSNVTVDATGVGNATFRVRNCSNAKNC
jgi:prepilin-type processing-associated H-X9-DG protein